MSASAPRRRIPLWFWPVVLLWRLATRLCSLIGILFTLGLGLLLMIVGMVLIQSLVGAVIGIPLFVFGFLLLIRGLY